MEEIQEIELRSEEVREILTRPPRWILKYGITLVFVVVIGLLVGSWFFRYPEVLTAPIVVSTENLPFNIVAKTSRRIDTLFVTEKQYVSKNQLLGILENSAKTDDVLQLEKEIANFNLDSLRTFAPSTFRAFALLTLRAFSLGELQNYYSNFQKTIKDYQFFIETDYHNKKIASIEKQKTVQQNILNQSIKIFNNNKRQLEVAQNHFYTDSNLFVKGVMSVFEFETSKNTYLQAQQSFENAKTAIENQKLGILQLEQTVFDLVQQKNEQISQLNLSLSNSLDQLKAQIETFKQTYFLISQIEGIVTFTKYYQNNQNVTASETILTIVPDEKQKIIGKIYLPPQRAGKVKLGQTVNVKFDDFPFVEYGMIKVELKNIALVPIKENGERFYVLEVDFPDELITTYNKTLIFRQQMQGIAEVITEYLVLLERFFNTIKAIFDK
jgi:HlyD family secretion protein